MASFSVQRLFYQSRTVIKGTIFTWLSVPSASFPRRAKSPQFSVYIFNSLKGFCHTLKQPLPYRFHTLFIGVPVLRAGPSQPSLHLSSDRVFLTLITALSRSEIVFTNPIPLIMYSTLFISTVAHPHPYCSSELHDIPAPALHREHMASDQHRSGTPLQIPR